MVVSLVPVAKCSDTSQFTARFRRDSGVADSVQILICSVGHDRYGAITKVQRTGFKDAASHDIKTAHGVRTFLSAQVTRSQGMNRLPAGGDLVQGRVQRQKLWPLTLDADRLRGAHGPRPRLSASNSSGVISPLVKRSRAMSRA